MVKKYIFAHMSIKAYIGGMGGGGLADISPKNVSYYFGRLPLGELWKYMQKKFGNRKRLEKNPKLDVTREWEKSNEM